MLPGQGQVGWLSRSQIAANIVEGYEGIVNVLESDRSHCKYIFINAIMRSQRLLRVRVNMSSDSAPFTDYTRLPQRKAYVLSAHAV